MPEEEANACASGTCPAVAQVWSALMFGGWSVCEHHPASYIAFRHAAAGAGAGRT